MFKMAREALLLIIFSTLLLASFPNSLFAKTIHKERSIYRNIVITESKHIRCMQFESRRREIANQACINLRNKKELVFEYAHAMMAGLAFNQTPKRILIIGLGGGTLPNAFSELLPDSEITSVEIDPAVVKLAKQYFSYKESDKIKTVVKDGRVFVKRALKNNEKFDWIILDAFNGDYIPEHLLTVEFLQETKSLLTKGGLLAANTFTSSKLYDYESVTYQKVFNDLMILKSPTKGNRIIFACNCTNISEKIAVDQDLKNRLRPFNVKLHKLMRRLSNKVDWDTSVQPLTDQFSPANLLNQ